MAVAAVPLGVFAATRHRRFGDYVAMTLSQLGIAVPGFWAGLLLVLLFGGAARVGAAGGFDGWGQGRGAGPRSLLLPAVALGLFQFAVLARTTRSAVLEVLREEYVKTARAKGVDEARVLFRHTLRNAMIPTVMLAGSSWASSWRGASFSSWCSTSGAGPARPRRHQRAGPAGGAGAGAVRGLDDRHDQRGSGHPRRPAPSAHSL